MCLSVEFSVTGTVTVTVKVSITSLASHEDARESSGEKVLLFLGSGCTARGCLAGAGPQASCTAPGAILSHSGPKNTGQTQSDLPLTRGGPDEATPQPAAGMGPGMAPVSTPPAPTSPIHNRPRLGFFQSAQRQSIRSEPADMRLLCSAESG